MGRGRRPALAAALCALIGVGCGGVGAGEPPDVTGMNGDEAVAVLEDAGFSVELDPDVDAVGCTVDSQDVGDFSDVLLTLDCPQLDWEAREGEEWEEFSDMYDAGFTDGCTQLFDLPPERVLYLDDDEYDEDDCLYLQGSAEDAVDVPVEVPDEPDAAGYDLGLGDGCEALFEDVGADAFFHGEDAYTADDCPSGGAAPAPPPEPTDPVTDACAAVDGLVIAPEAGDVDCGGAAALWREYERRAPAEGQGSGGYVDLGGGWGCIAAPPPEAPRLGSCSNETDGAEFVVASAG